MSGAPRVRSMNVTDLEARPVLGPAGNKAPLPTTRKTASKPLRKMGRAESETIEEKKASKPVDSPPLSSPAFKAPAMLRRQELLSNLSMNASCSSDASTDSFSSRASTGRIGRRSLTSRQRLSAQKLEKRVEKLAQDGTLMPPIELSPGKQRCAWVTSSSDPCYVAFHNEEWGVPTHEDRKLFELLVLSGALAELTWPAILSKRDIFRDVFMDFDPILVSKINEKKIVAPGSTASSLLSEPKLRAIVENARQILKVVEEFGSFDKYCWSFVNHKPIASKFRYPRQVPVKTPKADVISKDMVRRGFRSVGPTVIYSFMQSAGMTNDHLVGCYRFEECVAASADVPSEPSVDAAVAVDEVGMMMSGFELDLGRDVDG